MRLLFLIMFFVFSKGSVHFASTEIHLEKNRTVFYNMQMHQNVVYLPMLVKQIKYTILTKTPDTAKIL